MNSAMILRLSLGLLFAAASLPAADLPKIRVAPGDNVFQIANGQRFVPFGVNYFRPGTGWAPQLWKKFDADATRRDFARMKDLGVNCVRVFLSYGSFYMEPGVLSEDGLKKFDQFLTIAAEAGIYVHPTGPDHWEGIPEWARGDRYADEKILSAVEKFWTLFAARYRGNPAIFAYDLLNEPEIRWETPVMREKWNAWLQKKYASLEAIAKAWNSANTNHQFGKIPPPPAKDNAGDRQLLDYQMFRESLADDWTRRQANAIKAADPSALVTVGFIQWAVPVLLPGIQHYAAFRPERQAPLLDFLEIHFYPLVHGFYDYTNPEEETRNLAYLESVVREVARPGKPVVVAEFAWYGGGKPTIDGGKHPFAAEEKQARWCRLAVEHTAPWATGWLNWGFYDHPEAKDVTEFTGLVTVDGKTKAWGATFKELTVKFARNMPARPKLSRPPLDWDLCLTSAKAAAEFRESYHQALLKP